MIPQEYNVEYIWESLNDFWRMFEDAGVIEQLWRGYVFTVNNLYYQLYQLDLSKCIHTIPWRWISDWEVFVLDGTTRIDQDTPRYADFPYCYRMPFGVKDATVLRESPREVVNLLPNTYLGADNILVLPDGSRRHSTDTIYLPDEAVIDGDVIRFPNGVSVDCEKLYPNVDYKIDVVYEDPCGRQPVYYDVPTVHFKVEPYPRLWTNLAVRDLEIIYDNFGCLIDYYKPDSYRYLREVQGLWFAYWHGAAINNIVAGVNILKDLPFALEEGFVEEIAYTSNVAKIGNNIYELTEEQIAAIHIGDVVSYVNFAENVVGFPNPDPSAATELVYYKFPKPLPLSIQVGDIVSELYPSSTTVNISGATYPIVGSPILNVSKGEHLEQFTPLTKRIGVFDYINFPNWWREYAGNFNDYYETCFFDGYPLFDSGKFDYRNFDDTYSEDCLKAIFLQYFTFLVKVDQAVWFRSREEFQTVIAFLLAIKPAYTYFIFQLDLVLRDDALVFDKEYNIGWNFVPKDIPLDHHHFDEQYIHPLFDDGAYFDFDKERDYLCISVYGSPQIFSDSAAIGYTFDDPAVPVFDFDRTGIFEEAPIPEFTEVDPPICWYTAEGFPRIPFDSDPYQDGMVLEVTRKVPQLLEFSDTPTPVDANMDISET